MITMPEATANATTVDTEPSLEPAGAVLGRRRRPFGRPLPIHVPLLATVPALALWSANSAAIRSLYPARVALGCALAAVVLTAIIAIVQRDLRRAGFIGCVTVTFLCAGGFILTDPTSAVFNFAVVALVVLVAVAAGVSMPEAGIRTGTILLNVVAVALVGVNVGVVVAHRPGDFAVAQPGPTGATAGQDLWFLVPDRLPSEDTLASLGLDPGGFFDALRNRGFRLVEDARANYPQTDLSLAASWGLDYLGPHPTTSGEPFSRLSDPPIGQLFHDADYKYTHLGSWTDFSAGSRSADTVLTLQGAGEFWTAWESTTLLPSVRYLLDVGTPHAVTYARQIEHGLHQLDQLEELAAAEPREPEFVLAHLILPHGPYVFERDGTVRPRTADVTDEQGYEDQLAFLGRRLAKILDLLQQREDPPIIVLLSDEGLYPEDLDKTMDTGDVDPTRYDAAQIRNKMSILAAVYTPGGGSAGDLADDASAVNIVRSVVGSALSIDLPLLEDRSYWWGDSKRARLDLLDQDVLAPVPAQSSS